MFDLLVHGAPKTEALDAFIGVMETEWRDGLKQSFARREPGSSLDPAARRVTLERARAYVFPADQSREALAHAVAAHRRGPLGLALSGGGFRASFFHLGVLARLAELDLLRSLDVISGVSGGSIIGACYYLKLKRLLEEKHDGEVSRGDYLKLVSALCDEFLEGVQTNIRTRIFASPRAIARLWFVPGYTRTNRVAELIATELFARVTEDPVAPHAPFAELGMKPFGEADDFEAERHNWRRGAKVPRLVLNATTLNTGHNWQFTKTAAGEPAFAVDREVDATPRLRPVPYPDARSVEAGEKRRVTLASAVAASACVPGIFPPIDIPGLYADIRVRLVDGGVFDNQGISALLDAGCENVIVSDGCRQIDFDRAPAVFFWSALQRTNAILMERVRQLQFRALAHRRMTTAVRSVVDVHLTKGLEPEPLYSLSKYSPEEEVSREERFLRMKEDLAAMARGRLNHPVTRFGLPEEVQRLLARVRTDLDSFHEAEASALFWSGYRMAIADLAASGTAGVSPPASDPPAYPWRLAAPWTCFAEGDGWISHVVHLLDASQYRFFKLTHLTPNRGRIVALIAALAAALGWFGWRPVLSVAVGAFPPVATGLACATVLAATASILYGWSAGRRQGRSGRAAGEYFQQLVLGCLLPIAMIGAMLHLRFTDRWYLRRGAVILPKSS